MNISIKTYIFGLIRFGVFSIEAIRKNNTDDKLIINGNLSYEDIIRLSGALRVNSSVYILEIQILKKFYII